MTNVEIGSYLIIAAGIIRVFAAFVRIAEEDRASDVVAGIAWGGFILGVGIWAWTVADGLSTVGDSLRGLLK